MKAPIVRITSAVVVLLLAVALLAFGMMKNHKVYDADSDDFGMLTFRKISDSNLIVDTTFSGVTRKDDKLFSTYDRSETRAKRKCPT